MRIKKYFNTVCRADGCENKTYVSGYCQKHYAQVRTHGRVMARTKFDKNEVIKKKNYSEIIIYNISQKEKCRTLIDNDDLEKVKKYKWCSTVHGYIVTRKPKHILLHRLIMCDINHKNKLVIDHINRNPLDNRKENLRWATQSENVINKGLLKNNTSGYNGVYYDSYSKNWRVRIERNGVVKYATGKDKEDAIRIRLKLEETFKK